jgi:hypothetical protein
MATAGSLLGVWVTVQLSRKGGEALHKKVRSRRLEYVERQVKRNAGWATRLRSRYGPIGRGWERLVDLYLGAALGAVGGLHADTSLIAETYNADTMCAMALSKVVWPSK